MKRNLFTIAMVLGLSVPSFALTRNQPGRMASEFLDTVGATVRISEGQDPVKLAPLVAYIGAHRVMDNYTVNPAALTSLGAKQIVLEVGPNANDATIPAFIAAAKNYPVSSFYAFVGPYEPENYPVTYKGVTCGPQNTSWHCIAMWQHDWYQALKADPVLKVVPVTSPSDVGQETTNEGLQFANITGTAPGLAASAASGWPTGTRFWNYGNTHCRQGTGKPAGVNQSWFCYYPYPFPLDGDPTLENPAENFQITLLKGYKGYDIVGTGTLPNFNSCSGVVTDGTPAGDAHKGFVDIAAWIDSFFFNRPNPATGEQHGTLGVFMPLVDTPETKGMGFYSSYTTPRPSAVFIHNLTTWLADAPTHFTPANMIWTISGDDNNFRSIGLEKTTGVFEVIAVDEDQPPNLSKPEVRTVSFPATVSSVKVFDPVLGQVTATYSNVISFTVTFSSAHPIYVFEYTP